VTSRRRLGRLLVGRETLVPRIVEVVVVGWIAGLVGTQRRFERNAVLFEPCEVVDARVAEVAKRLFSDHALHLERQVPKHFIRVVGCPGFALDVRAAASVKHTTADRGRAASMKTVEHQHARPVGACLECRACPRASKSDDDRIGLVVPRFSVGFGDYQRRFGRIGGQ